MHVGDDAHLYGAFMGSSLLLKLRALATGWSALVLCIILGPRLGFKKESMPPHSMVLCMVGYSIHRFIDESLDRSLRIFGADTLASAAIASAQARVKTGRGVRSASSAPGERSAGSAVRGAVRRSGVIDPLANPAHPRVPSFPGPASRPAGISVLPPRLEHHHRDRVRQVEAAVVGAHRQADALGRREILAQRRRQAAGLGTEHEHVAREPRAQIATRRGSTSRSSLRVRLSAM